MNGTTVDKLLNIIEDYRKESHSQKDQIQHLASGQANASLGKRIKSLENARAELIEENDKFMETIKSEQSHSTRLSERYNKIVGEQATEIESLKTELSKQTEWNAQRKKRAEDARDGDYEIPNKHV